MNEVIRSIIEAGTMAPSGDNCQPWRFEANDSQINIFNVPERDTSLYNYKQRASLVALGACIENMLITARKQGCEPCVIYFPTPDNEQHVARVDLSRGNATDEPLFTAIPARAINRRPYRGGTLPAETLDCIRNAAAHEDISGCSLKLMQGDEMAVPADIAALSDRLVFENRLLHGFLFEHLRWNQEEAELTRDGLDIRTLELAKPDRMMFPLLAHFSIVRLIRMFGATRMIEANARKLMLSSSAAGIITIADTSPVNWLNAGRMLERIWLEATRQGLAFHLMTGITLLSQRVQDGELEGLDSANLSLVKQTQTLLKQAAGSELPVALLFRIGRCDQPTARSLRLAVENVTTRM